MGSVDTATYDNRIAGNNRASVQALYAAEAGINEFMARFRAGATNQISDSASSNPTWNLLLAKYPGQGATKIGYIFGNPNNIQSLQSDLDFGVQVKHKVNVANNVITQGGYPIYIVDSYGFTADGGNKVVEVEISKGSGSLDPPAALYTNAPTTIKATSTYIQGNDQCGSNNKYGIITTQSSVTINGNPTIGGIGTSPSIQTNSTPPLDLQGMVNNLKGNASFSYSPSQPWNGNSDPWGIPTSDGGTSNPLTYTGPMNVVYFNMDLTLTGHAHGAGLLLVNGNLDLHGGIYWYGVIIVTGSLTYSGGGENNITGAVFAGNSPSAAVYLKGNSGILYCGGAVTKAQALIPFKMTRWRDVF